MTIIEQAYDWNGSLTQRNWTGSLILHHAAISTATAQDIHRIHRANGWVGIGYHYYVRKDGLIYRGRPESTIGAHTTGANVSSIGICFEGNFDTEDMTSAQLQSGQELVADIRRRYPGIAVSMHKQHNATACPGRNFRFNDILNPPAIPQEKPKEEIDMTKAEVQAMINEAVQSAVAAVRPVVYKTIDDVPEWGKAAVQGLIDKGHLQGDETGLNLTHDFLRTIVLLDRMGLCSIEEAELLFGPVELD